MNQAEKRLDLCERIQSRAFWNRLLVSCCCCCFWWCLLLLFCFAIKLEPICSIFANYFRCTVVWEHLKTNLLNKKHAALENMPTPCISDTTTIPLAREKNVAYKTIFNKSFWLVPCKSANKYAEQTVRSRFFLVLQTCDESTYSF